MRQHHTQYSFPSIAWLVFIGIVFWGFASHVILQHRYDVAKTILFYGGMCALSIGLLVRSLLRPGAWKAGTLHVLLGAYAIYAVLRATQSNILFESVAAASTEFFWIASIFILAYLPSHYRRASLELCIVSISIAVLGELTQLNALLPFPEFGVPPLGNISFLGDVCALLLPATLLLSQDTTTSKIHRLYHYACALCMLSGLWYSGSRISMIAAALVLFAGTVVAIRTRIVSRQNAIRLALGVVLCISIGAALMPHGARQVAISDRFAKLLTLDPAEANYHRWHMALASRNMIQDKPLFGWGPGTFRFSYPEYSSQVTSYIKNERASDILPVHPHNMFLFAGIELGLIGCALLAAAILGCLVSAWRQFRTAQALREQIMALAALAGLMTALLSWQINTGSIHVVSRVIAALFFAHTLAHQHSSFSIAGSTKKWIAGTLLLISVFLGVIFARYQAGEAIVAHSVMAAREQQLPKPAFVERIARANQLSPGSLFPLVHRTRLSFREDPFSEATRRFVNELRTLYPGVAAALQIVAEYELIHGNLPAAEQLALKALSLDKRSPHSLMLLHRIKQATNTPQ